MILPNKIGRYEIIDRLGRGGMATVYLAHDPRFDREVAVKVLPREFLHDETFRGRFEREAKTIASLDHPAIVPVYDYGEEDGQPYLIMRYMSGGSLEDRLAKGTLPLANVVRIVRRIASALDEAHQKGIIHRDLKPGNILFDHRDDAFLSDFGIVKLAQSAATFTGTGIIGTPAYMSPEQIHGEVGMDGRSDIYTLGVILFQMLAGEMPYKADTPAKQMMAHVLNPVPNILQVRPDLPPQFETVIRQAMAKQPEERFDTASRMALALESSTVEDGVTLSTITPVPLPPDLGETVISDAALDFDKHEAAAHEARDHTAYHPGNQTLVGEKPRRAVPPLPWLIGGLIALLILGSLCTFAGSRFVAGRPRPTPTAQIFVAAVTPTQAEVAAAVPTAESASEEVIAAEAPAADVAIKEPEPPAEPTVEVVGAPTDSAAEEIAPTETAEPTPIPRRTVQGAEIVTLGQSVRGAPIEAIRIGSGPKAVVLVGGMHAGFAPGTVIVAQQMIAALRGRAEDLPPDISIYIIPNINPDSVVVPAPGQLDGRLNANGVDLNRNFDCAWQAEAKWRTEAVSGGTAPLSEPESQALADFWLSVQPQAVIVWEARASNGLVSAGNCGDRPKVSDKLATIYQRASGYPKASYEVVTEQTLTGDAVNWLDSIEIPAITVLLPEYTEPDFPSNLDAVLAVIRELSDRN